MSNDFLISTHDLVKEFPDGVRAVDGLTIKIKRGEVFGFLGPNGAGKTTSIKMMVGLLKPTSGKTIIDGETIEAGSEVVKEKIGVCPQEITLWDRLTVYENLRLIGDLYETPKEKLNRQIDSLLRELQLEDKRKTRATSLSGGMKRRLNLAMALVHDPEIVVLDEPSPGLDPQSRLVLWDYINTIPKMGDKTVILTTHFMEEADRLCKRVAIIDHGKLLVDDSPEKLKNNLGEGDVVELTLEEMEGSEKLAKDLEKMETVSKVHVVGNKIWLNSLNAVKHLPEIFHQVEIGNKNIVDVKLRKNTLEDVFISLTGRGLRE
jgi:ABC-2 type transport system ATP-binding protein